MTSTAELARQVDIPGSVLVDDVRKKEGEKNGRKWTLYTVTLSDGRKATTFDKELAKSAQEAKTRGIRVIAITEQTDKGANLIEIRAATPTQTAPPVLDTPLPTPAAGVEPPPDDAPWPTDTAEQDKIPFVWLLPMMLPLSGLLGVLLA